MPIPVPTVGSYPTIEDVFQAARIHISDVRDGATSMVGESRVATDPWTPSIQYLNLALQALQRDCQDKGMPATREVSFIINGLAPVNSTLGVGAANPAIQVSLGFEGFNDGLVLHNPPVLPADLLVPIKVGQRITGSGTLFSPVPLANDDLPSINQGVYLGFWCWRTDHIWFNGSQNTMDIQLLYEGGLPKYAITLNPDFWPTTLVPILDSADVLAWKVAQLFVAPRAAQYPPGAVDYVETSYKSQMIQLVNRWIKTAQRAPACREGFGDDGSYGDGWSWS